ncbi:hypothetical protein KRR38_15820 [Novosphingobium sp. G106]|uniref:hypothetical protein n=1 Tax=Novosphingobium sp. G106 TaxID=2849500 RepID=UPI001C2D390E|nr:hypothetical protein [Novosphingobium sp. G106]MBV1689101.1 hypothetical protein [Novosphingobium sp. G106]
MKRTPDRSTRRPLAGRWALIAALLALASSAKAQSVQDYRLPPAPLPTATAAGPVDSDHPVAAPSKNTPAPEPTVAPPIVVPPAPAAATPTVRPSTAAAPRVAPSPRAEAQAAPSSTPTAVPLPKVEPAAVPTAVATEPAAAPSTAPVPAMAAPEENEHWLWIAIAAALVLMLGGLLRWRHRARGSEAVEYEPTADLEPAPSPPASLTHPPSRREPPPAAPSTAPPPPRAQLRPLEMQLEARHLSRAMVNATLAYRLTLTNQSDASSGPLRIAGDIVSAHASLSAAEQLAPGEAALAAIHEVPALAPGESVTLSGELRMPIASILPINSGGSRVFVPLARFRAETPESATTRVFVIGQASEQPGGALRPFPLDRGPGVDRALDQRELEMPA